MKPVNVIIVDVKSSKRLEQVLAHHEELKILEKTDKIESLFLQYARHNPEIVFLDVDNIDRKELEILYGAIQKDFNFKLLVLIANRIEQNSFLKNIDSIVSIQKPVTHTKINTLLKQFHISRTRNEVVLNTASLYGKNRSDKMTIPVITGLKIIVINEIIYIEKDNENPKNVLIHTVREEGTTVSATMSLKQILQVLFERSFYQINRNTIINLDYLLEVETKSRICILSKNGEYLRLPVSQPRLKEFREYLNAFNLDNLR